MRVEKLFRVGESLKIFVFFIKNSFWMVEKSVFKYNIDII